MAKMVPSTPVAEVDLETGRRFERLGQSVLKKTDDHREGAKAIPRKAPTELDRDLKPRRSPSACTPE